MDATEGKKMWLCILVLTLWRHWSIWKECALVTLVGVVTPQLPMFVFCFFRQRFFSNNSGCVSTKTSNFFNWQTFSSLSARWDTVGFSLVSHWAEREVNFCLAGCIFQRIKPLSRAFQTLQIFAPFSHATYFPAVGTGTMNCFNYDSQTTLLACAAKVRCVITLYSY